jgi:hypothetical protein
MNCLPVVDRPSDKIAVRIPLFDNSKILHLTLRVRSSKQSLGAKNVKPVCSTKEEVLSPGF